jgi:hypothetical protein
VNHDHETQAAITKVAAAWIAGLIGMRLSDWVLAATLTYTVLQCFFLLRDKWWRERKSKKGAPH